MPFSQFLFLNDFGMIDPCIMDNIINIISSPHSVVSIPTTF